MSKIDYKQLLRQIISFIIVSGIGWIIDFSIFTLLSYLTDWKIIVINILSSTPALTYVFLLSNKKIFKNTSSRLSLRTKYLIYFAYQLVLLLVVSTVGEALYGLLGNILTLPLLLNNLKIIVKIMITPLTMISNFLVMKNLIEKL